MAIQKEIWTDFIAENLYMSNEFIKLCMIEDSNVVNRTVHSSSAGTAASVTRNRTVLPATVTQRVDQPVSYDIDEFTIDPTLIPDADKVELAYNKMQSVMYDIVQNLSKEVGDWMLYNWRVTTAAYQVRTTGTGTPNHVTGGSGTRKKLVAADIQAAALAMNDAEIPEVDRYLLLDAYMYDHLLTDLRFGEFRETIKEADLARGIIGNLYGFDIMRRGRVISYTNAGTPVPRQPGAAGLATANAGAIGWQKAAVERAFGEINFFEKLDDPLYYGDVYSGLVRAGGRKRRYDGKGVIAIIQTLLT